MWEATFPLMGWVIHRIEKLRIYSLNKDYPIIKQVTRNLPFFFFFFSLCSHFFSLSHSYGCLCHVVGAAIFIDYYCFFGYDFYQIMHSFYFLLFLLYLYKYICVLNTYMLVWMRMKVSLRLCFWLLSFCLFFFLIPTPLALFMSHEQCINVNA